MKKLKKLDFLIKKKKKLKNDDNAPSPNCCKFLGWTESGDRCECSDLQPEQPNRTVEQLPPVLPLLHHPLHLHYYPPSSTQLVPQQGNIRQDLFVCFFFFVLVLF